MLQFACPKGGVMEQHNHIGPKLKALSTAITQEINRGTAELGLTGSQSFFLGYLVRHRDRTVYPRDLVLGRIIDAGYDDTGVAKYAVLEPAVNVSSIEQVFVITEYDAG